MTQEEWIAIRDHRQERLDAITPQKTVQEKMEAEWLEREIRIAERYIRRKGK